MGRGPSDGLGLGLDLDVPAAAFLAASITVTCAPFSQVAKPVLPSRVKTIARGRGPVGMCAEDLERARVDGDDHVVLLGGHVDHLAVGAHRDALGLLADVDLVLDLARARGRARSSRRSPRSRRRASCRRARGRTTRGPGRWGACAAACAGEVDDADAVGGAIGRAAASTRRRPARRAASPTARRRGACRRATA